jgi:hypothetical protein
MRIIFALLLSAFSAFGAVGSWNGAAFTAWNGVAQTAWNGSGVSCASGGGAITNNLVFHFKMNEASGSALDSFGSNNLTDNGSVGSAAGQVGNARSFSAASTQYFDLADNDAISTGDIDFTYFAGFYITDETANRPILRKGNSSYDECIILYQSGPDNLIAFMKDLGANVVSSGTITGNAWHSVFVWYDSTADTWNMKVDGVSSTPTTGVAGGNTSTPGPLEIGRSTGPTYFNGRIDQVMMWKRVLTAGEMTTIINNFNAGTEPY